MEWAKRYIEVTYSLVCLGRARRVVAEHSLSSMHQAHV